MATIRKLRGKWQAQVRRKGIPPRAKSFVTRSQAEAWARNIEAEIDRCGTAGDTRTAERMTLKAVLERYILEVTPSKRGAASERYRLMAMASRPIAHRTLAMLTSSDVASYRDDRLKEVSSATVIRELSILAHAIDVARREWDIYLPLNPARLVRKPKSPRGRDRRLSPGEEEMLLLSADAGRNPYMRSVIIFALETAMRRGEMLSLTWDDIDLEKRIAHLDETKNGDSRDVPLSTRAINELKHLKRHGFRQVFPTSASAVQQAWLHLRKRAGMEDLHFHDLRHEGVTRLFEKGLNILEVAAISGHKDIKMLSRYTHLRAVDLVHRLD